MTLPEAFSTTTYAPTTVYTTHSTQFAQSHSLSRSSLWSPVSSREGSTQSLLPSDEASLRKTIYLKPRKLAENEIEGWLDSKMQEQATNTHCFLLSKFDPATHTIDAYVKGNPSKVVIYNNQILTSIKTQDFPITAIVNPFNGESLETSEEIEAYIKSHIPRTINLEGIQLGRDSLSRE